jgi:uncharacterized protein (TIGR02594 family)
MLMLRTRPKGLNLRAQPSATAAILRVLPEGTALRGHQLVGEWRGVRTLDGTPGWVAERFTEPHAAPWMVVAIGETGVAEIAGAEHNPRIVEYHATTTLRATTDEVPWCSSFANWCMAQVGVPGTRSAAARSWLAWGRRLEEPTPGCVAVFRRGPRPTSGHVAFFVRREGARILVLGGNQSNRVRESWYPAADLLDYRAPA